MTGVRRSSAPCVRATSAPGLRHLIAVATLYLASGQAWSAPSATVLFASGEVHAVSAKGESRELKTGAQIESGEVVKTGKGRVQLRMIDGAMMALSEQTTLRLDDYRVATAAGEEPRGFMSLMRGALRTISGSIGHPRAEEYRLDTPSGTIGIRGTEYTAAIGAAGELDVGVIGGRVAVCNDGGCVDVPKGFGAHTPNRLVKPAVAAKSLVLLQPANAAKVVADEAKEAKETTAPAAAGETPAAAAPPVATAAAESPSTSVATTATGGAAPVAEIPTRRNTPTSGEQVTQFLVAALTPPPAPAPGAQPSTPEDSDALPPLPGATNVGSSPVAGSVPGRNAPIVLAPTPAPSPPGAPAPSMPPAPPAPPAPAPGPGQGPAPSPAPGPGPGAGPGPGPGAGAGAGAGAGPGPGPGPNPPSGPGTGPAPSPGQIPLPNGNVTLGVVWSTEKGEVASGLTQGTAHFNPQGGLLDVDNPGKGKSMFEKGVPTDVGANGVIGWGRWTDGQSKVKGNGNGKGVGDGNLATLHYFAIAATPTGPVAGTFSSFASTAPTVQSDGKLVAVGSVNGATGSFNASLQLELGGRANYSLTVPVANQTFSLVGSATQTSPSGFSGVSLISSTGTGCLGGCTGSLGNNISVIGQIAGAAGTQAGVAYGFDSRIGNVSGVIIFKR